MKQNREEFPFNSNKMEKWLEDFFLNPLTTYLDESTFRIDLFDTNEEIIVEALLTDFEPINVSVFLSDENLIIKACSRNLKRISNEKNCKTRIISFPFQITKKAVTAKLEKGILEVIISKNICGSGKNRFISFPKNS